MPTPIKHGTYNNKLTHKRCATCGETLPVSAFYWHTDQGPDAHCKACKRANKRKRYAERQAAKGLVVRPRVPEAVAT